MGRRMWDRLPGIETDEPAGTGSDRAAVLVPLFADESGVVRVILTKRPMTMPTHAGHIAFPGGRPDPEDSGPIATALREAEEEVGIDPASVELLGFLPVIHTVEFTLFVVPVVGRIQGVPELRPSPREVERVFLPRVADLADESAWRFELWQGRKVWFFDLDGEVLWGATARMVRDLVGLH
ncbi:MAG TPA: CoA pyrophosphatase [Acidimicrobiia bacterium]|nr:CoA pyrophosphatase [Acidimicrobiia bacterium]